MKKHESDAKTVLNQLGKLSVFLADLDTGADSNQRTVATHTGGKRVDIR